MKKHTAFRFFALILALTIIVGATPPAALADSGQSTASTTVGTGNSIELMAEDKDGNTVPAAGAKHGEAVRILLPLKCKHDKVTELSICPVVGDINTFPFKVTKQDYTKIFPQDWDSSIVEVNPIKDVLYELSFHFSIHDEASKGTKMVAFLVKYKLDGVDQEETITVPVDVQDSPSGSSSSSGGSSGSGSGSRLTPKVIIESFSFDPATVYAGDSFELALDLVNTSTREGVRNMQVSISDASGIVMPANNGSNTQYVDRIEKSGSKKGNTKSLIFPMQVVPDAEPKSVLLTIDIVYNSALTKDEYKAAQTLAVPVQQKQRIKFGEPIVYDEAWVGQTVSAAVQMFNLGKSPIYNAAVAVEGEGLAMEESYFGGNVAAGGTLRAEFNIIPSVGGDIEGTVVITYEDVYGNPTEKRLPLKLFVNENQPEPEIADPSAEAMQEQPPVDTTVRILGMPWYLLAIALILLAVIVTLLIIRAKKKRAKELMEL